MHPSRGHVFLVQTKTMAKFSMNEEALTSQNYTSFLLSILRAGQKTPPRGSIADLARRSGLSRSFLTEIFSGKKNLTPTTLAKISSGLRLQGDAKRLFEVLSALSSREVRSAFPGDSDEALHVRLEQLRQRLRRQMSSTTRLKPRSGAPLSSEIFVVYAALGALDRGVSSLDIVAKTGLPKKVVLQVLADMEHAGWVARSDGKYFAIEKSIDLSDLGSDLGFVRAFSEASAQLAKGTKEISEDPNNLIFFSGMPVNPKRLSEMKAKLRSMLLEVMDEFQDDDGSQIKKITLGMF